MAHDISRISGAPEFVSTRLEWHGIGTIVDEAMTAEDAITQARLAWEVQQRSLHLPNGLTIPDRVANVREGLEGQDIYLGAVGRTYRIIQNEEAFSFLDVLVGRGEAVIETAGALKKGRKVFVTAKLPGDITVGERDDRTQKYLLVMNSHDGSSACKALFTPVRVCCANTLRVALRRADTDSSVSIRHSGNIRAKISEAERVLGSAVRHFDEVSQLFKTWRRREVTLREARDFFEQLFPLEDGARLRTRNRIERTRSELAASFMTGPGADMAGLTAWGLFNSVTHWVDHLAWKHRRPNAERRFENTQLGAGAQLKQRAASMLMSMAS